VARKTDKRPFAGKPSKFLPGDKVILHATVEHTRDEDGREMISVSVRGSKVYNLVYLSADDAEPDPSTPGREISDGNV